MGHSKDLMNKHMLKAQKTLCICTIQWQFIKESTMDGK